ncbi:hypothetical protein VP01_2251g5 [Puccinia sorghi]|uniref:Uncharacterized protein n=1 Tax=Puccinia sorghi TaxID=27349 RepID=A0A0L6V8H3_9BASI|nr:hypothetical protein VP01_2251g5 [Puccinia sorghi]
MKKVQGGQDTQKRFLDWLKESKYKLAKLWFEEELNKKKRVEISKALEEKNKKQLFNPFLGLNAFDGCQDTPVEVLHVLLLDKGFESLLDCIQHQFTEHAKSQTLINGGSLSKLHWKGFQEVVRWPTVASMCVLGSCKFQKIIEDLKNHIRELQIAIEMSSRFQHSGLTSPSFTCLFASEKFKSYNGALRASPIHSNCHSPGRDISNTFSNYQAMRLVLSVAYMWDKKESNILKHLIKFQKFSKTIIKFRISWD